ncbi:MAG: DMT family transporter [Methylophagaceae bacterium]
MNAQNPPHHRLAIASLLFSASLWGLIWYPLRLLNEAGMSAVWSSLIMYLAAGIVAIPMLYKQYNSISFHRADLLALAIAAGITNVAFVVALIEGEVMRVMLLFYLSPLWTVLLGRWWLGERLSQSAIMMFAVAMTGSIIMLWNPEIGWPWPHGVADWLALMASIAFSINNVLARKLGPVPMGVKTGVVWWGVVVTSIVVLLWQQTSVPDVDLSVWAGAALLGLIGITTMTIAVLYGVGKMPVYRSAVIMLFELIVAAIAAWLLTDEIMSLQEWLGGILILAAAYGVARSEMHEQ